RVVLSAQPVDGFADAAALIEYPPRAREHMRKGAAQGRIVIDDQDAEIGGVSVSKSSSNYS
ncbi:hypothetical protein RZS08_61390, partial [Arthrospira platensis SPKY1]|nr:hypothetical protein [Arthrospira platensis SPKY1]